MSMMTIVVDLMRTLSLEALLLVDRKNPPSRSLALRMDKTAGLEMAAYTQEADLRRGRTALLWLTVSQAMEMMIPRSSRMLTRMTTASLPWRCLDPKNNTMAAMNNVRL